MLSVESKALNTSTPAVVDLTVQLPWPLASVVPAIVVIVGVPVPGKGADWLRVVDFTEPKLAAAHELWRHMRCNACVVKPATDNAAVPKDLRGATPVAGRNPLVVVSHGYGNVTAGLSWLGENLASKGYVVAAIRHEDPRYGDRSQFARPMLRRPLDIGFVARTLQAEQDLQPAIFLGGGLGFDELDFGEVQLAAQIGAQVVGALVLGDGAQQFLEQNCFLVRWLGLAAALFYPEVLRRQVGGHGCPKVVK